MFEGPLKNYIVGEITAVKLGSNFRIVYTQGFTVTYYTFLPIKEN